MEITIYHDTFELVYRSDSVIMKCVFNQPFCAEIKASKKCKILPYQYLNYLLILLTNTEKID